MWSNPRRRAAVDCGEMDQGDVREETVVGKDCGGKSGSHGSEAIPRSHAQGVEPAPSPVSAHIPPPAGEQQRLAFTVQLSHPYMTTGETRALTRGTFDGKVMSLLLNMLSRLVITFLLRSKHLLISWLQSLSALILEPPKIKSDSVSTVFPSISHEVVGLDAMIFIF